MRLFSKKGTENKKDSIRTPPIDCNTVIKDPPNKYGKPSRPEPLSKNEFDHLKQLIAFFEQQDILIPTKSQKLETSGYEVELNEQPLSVCERLWLSKERLLRFLRSTNWDIDEAIARLKATIIWRREFGLCEDDNGGCSNFADIVATENETGKMYLLGYDRQRRPLLHIKTGRQTTPTSFAQIQLLAYMIESAEALMPQGVEHLTLLIDFKNYNNLATPLARLPAISVSKQVLHLVQQHYPESLGRAVLTNIPWYGWNFLKLFHPFIDPSTRSKIVYDEAFENYVENSQLELIHSGRLNFAYDNNIYLSDLSQCIAERKNHMRERFLELGGSVALSEFDLKGELSFTDKDRYPRDSNQSQPCNLDSETDLTGL
ncbi:LANO_0G02410g1_1 [Lachancea nothofagi CBS 11611]|uniref:LANO_0G02410g1_1 n=1 Tax=Lachancea nothofagi CBS 11611 TaxID=1266666 RepID=A0A1G4KF70_9SACH|nr:LANO_0G02410g1_1 [Lachancea nothofagi CBS 11611]